MIPGAIAVLGSMATRGLLAELAAAWGEGAAAEAAGGVEAARRVRAGEAPDVLVLAGNAMRALEAEGLVRPGSLVGVAVSAIVAAVREGEALPDLSNAAAVQEAVRRVGRVGYSTGPSGDHLLRLLEGWGMRGTMAERLVQAPPGVPVGRLLVEGAVDLAFQQRSELTGLPGVAVAGPLPRAIAADTVFTAGVPRAAAQPEAAGRFVAFLAAAAQDGAKRRHGMEPAA